MKNSITVQDIANALGLSRNTVSKALNGKPVPARTRNAVISAAIEMGYKGFGMAAALREPARDRKRLLILSSRMLMGMSYYVQVLRGIEEALFLAGEEPDLDMSVLYPDPVGYDPEHMAPAIRSMSRLPELFVAANDNIALGLMDTLASLGVRVPEDAEVLGFDNIAESRRCSPQLTTVNVNKLTLGRKIAALLRSRMDAPSQPNQTVYLPSTVISRESA